MKLYTIETGFFKLDGGAMFGVVPKTLWNRVQPADENNLCTWAMRCLLVEDGNRLMLIDTGIGDKQDAKFFSHYYLHGNNSLHSSLAAHGFSTEDITDVFLTHLHFDHVGGSVIRRDDKLVPAFKNATYWSNKDHWQHATVPNAREKASFLKENILPISDSGQLRYIELPENNPYPDTLYINQEIRFTENISIRVVNGHTEKMMLPQIRYKDKTILYMADLLPGVCHLPIPYVMAYDINPLQTLVEKENIFTEALTNEYVLFLEHDPNVACCTLQQTEKGIREKETFRLEDI
ncbi:MAG: MBL fold metallo-hydrolase [Chitinophagaceae bacterium]|nr:MAG: MBL fold metallo-hydrolase [Chitinophagaceae bacterium]